MGPRVECDTYLAGEGAYRVSGGGRQLAAFDFQWVKRLTFGENAFHQGSLLRIGSKSGVVTIRSAKLVPLDGLSKPYLSESRKIANAYDRD